MVAGELWNDSECCNWTVEDQAIEFGDDVCATLVLQYDDEQTKISCMHFMIERLLNGGIADEDEVTEFEVILDDDGGMLLFEMDHSFDSSSIDIRGKCCQVRLTFLTSDGTPSNQVSQGNRGGGRRKQIGCFSDVEGQKWMCASGCEVQGAAHASADCDLVGPHGGSDEGVPP